MTDRLNLADRARLDFALALRQQWARQVYPTLVNQARQPEPSRLNSTEAVHEAAVYPWFAWLERASQKLLWRAVSDTVGAEGDASGPKPSASDREVGELTLDPDLALPDWYTSVDIHLQPGGIWADERSARIYELGAKLVMLGDNDDYLFHQLFVDTAVPDGPYRLIVDLGCGFGKSTRPFKKRWPDAEVVGLDLAAPVLRLAHHRATDAGLDIRFVQRDARHTGLETGAVDVVCATMLLHELPPEVIGEVLTETARLLAPGGVVRMLDFQPTGDPIRDLAMVEHGQRNNEPYLPGLFETDVLELCRQAGLIDARWVAFDERGQGRLDDTAWPARQEWHFPWAVLEARKPEANSD